MQNSELTQSLLTLNILYNKIQNYGNEYIFNLEIFVKFYRSKTRLMCDACGTAACSRSHFFRTYFVFVALGGTRKFALSATHLGILHAICMFVATPEVLFGRVSSVWASCYCVGLWQAAFVMSNQGGDVVERQDTHWSNTQAKHPLTTRTDDGRPLRATQEQFGPDQSEARPCQAVRKLESVLDTVFGSCTGGIKAAASYFSQCRGVVPEETRKREVILTNPLRQSRSKDRHHNENSLFFQPQQDAQEDEGYELGSVSFEDTISTISACTLEDLAHMHHPMHSPSHCVREQPSPRKVDLCKGRSSSTNGSHPSLATTASGSSTASEHRKRTTFKDRKTPLLSNRKVIGNEPEAHEATMKLIQQHDMLMSELSLDLHGTRWKAPRCREESRAMAAGLNLEKKDTVVTTTVSYKNISIT